MLAIRGLAGLAGGVRHAPKPLSLLSGASEAKSCPAGPGHTGAQAAWGGAFGAQMAGTSVPGAEGLLFP